MAKSAWITAILSVALASAQAPAADSGKSPGLDDVVATVEGEKITPRMIQRLRNGAAPQFQDAAKQSNRAFLKSVAGLLALSKLAEQEKLDEKEPYRDQLAFVRLNFLANAYIANLNQKAQVSQEEIQRYYKEHQAEYEEAVVRAIYIAFSLNPDPEPAEPGAKKRLTEGEALAKAGTLVQELKKGADFAQLAKEHSDDASSAEKGGDIGPVKRSASGVPQEIRQAIFALKPGEVTDVIKQPAGFYLFKLEELRAAPYEEVAPGIATNLQANKVREELNRILSNLKITYDNEGYFSEEPLRPNP